MFTRTHTHTHTRTCIHMQPCIYKVRAVHAHGVSSHSSSTQLCDAANVMTFMKRSIAHPHTATHTHKHVQIHAHPHTHTQIEGVCVCVWEREREEKRERAVLCMWNIFERYCVCEIFDIQRTPIQIYARIYMGIRIHISHHIDVSPYNQRTCLPPR